MSVVSGLHAREIYCLVVKLVDEVRLLGVFARDELPDFTREIGSWCLILNTDPKDKPETNWLALYAPLSGDIKLFDSFGFSPSMYSLDFLDPLHSSYSLQSLSTSVCSHYCIVRSIFVLIIIHLVTLFICLLISRVMTYGSNSIFTILKFVFAFSIHITVLVNVANYNVNFAKPIKIKN